VARYLRAQVDTLTDLVDAVRADEPDAVHRMRVATRRLRSALATFEPLLEPADRLRDDARWLGRRLGAVRDAEVMAARLAEHASGLGDDDAVAALARVLEERHRTAHAELVEALDSPRAGDLTRALDRFRAAPLVPGASGKDLRRRVRKDHRRVVRRLEAALAEDDPAVRDPLLHEARKAAKRLRYAAEAVAPAVGKPAVRLAAAAEELQEVLGEHQDAVTARALLERLRPAATEPETWLHARLALVEHDLAGRAEARVPRARRRLGRTKVRGWLG
jgi:CHAD domain-containing protein